VAAGLPEVILVLAEVHFLHDGGQAVQAAKCYIYTFTFAPMFVVIISSRVNYSLREFTFTFAPMFVVII
jgi:hypothetical protein